MGDKKAAERATGRRSRGSMSGLGRSTESGGGRREYPSYEGDERVSRRSSTYRSYGKDRDRRRDRNEYRMGDRVSTGRERDSRRDRFTAPGAQSKQVGKPLDEEMYLPNTRRHDSDEEGGLEARSGDRDTARRSRDRRSGSRDPEVVSLRSTGSSHKGIGSRSSTPSPSRFVAGSVEEAQRQSDLQSKRRRILDEAKRENRTILDRLGPLPSKFPTSSANLEEGEMPDESQIRQTSERVVGKVPEGIALTNGRHADRSKETGFGANRKRDRWGSFSDSDSPSGRAEESKEGISGNQSGFSKKKDRWASSDSESEEEDTQKRRGRKVNSNSEKSEDKSGRSISKRKTDDDGVSEVCKGMHSSSGNASEQFRDGGGALDFAVVVDEQSEGENRVSRSEHAIDSSRSDVRIVSELKELFRSEDVNPAFDQTKHVASSQSSGPQMSDMKPFGDIRDEDDGLRLSPYHSLVYGCRSVDRYERLNRIEEGTYGVVFRARDKDTGEVVALKQVKMTRDGTKEGFPITALRETNILLALNHPNIVNVKEMVVGSSHDKIYMVMEYAEHDIKNVMETKMKQAFSQSEVKCLMLQLLSAIEYMHANWYIHRDLKTSNLLYNNHGRMRVCDFGLARKYGDPIREYTHLVITLWYRPPELLLGAEKYSTAVDMWSVGCIFAELLTRKPLLPGKSEIEQLDLIFKLLGAPSEERWPGYSKLRNAAKWKWKAQKYSKLREKFPQSSFSGGPYLSNAGFDLLSRMLILDPLQRISAAEALKHEWFRESPLPKSEALMPTFPASNEGNRYKRADEADQELKMMFLKGSERYG